MYSLSRPIETELIYQKKCLRLNLTFDSVLRMYALWKDTLFSDQEKVELSIEILIKNNWKIRKIPVTQKNEILKIIFENFISTKSKGEGSNEEPIFDFQQDAGYIFASFMMDYNIDLIEQQRKLHWWKFLSLFRGLSEKTKIREIMSIRSRPIPAQTKHNQEEIKHLMQMKSYYALEISQDEQEKRFEKAVEKLAGALEKRAVRNHV